MSDLDPKQIAALQKLREQEIAELRKKEGRAFSPAEIAQFLTQFEKLHGPLDPARPHPQSAPAGISFFGKWHKFLLRLALPATAILLVGLIVWSSSTPSGVVFPADPGKRLPSSDGIPVLPDNIRVDFEKQRIEFFGGGDKLAGSMAELAAESSPDVQAYQVTVKGKDAKGLEGIFEGRALFTRTVTGAPIRLKADVKRIEVQGDLRISGVGSFQVRREYVP